MVTGGSGILPKEVWHFVSVNGGTDPNMELPSSLIFTTKPSQQILGTPLFRVHHSGLRVCGLAFGVHETSSRRPRLWVLGSRG